VRAALPEILERIRLAFRWLPGPKATKRNQDAGLQPGATKRPNNR